MKDNYRINAARTRRSMPVPTCAQIAWLTGARHTRRRTPGITSMSKIAGMTTSQLISAIASAKHLSSLQDHLSNEEKTVICDLLRDLNREKADRRNREIESIRSLKPTARC